MGILSDLLKLGKKILIEKVKEIVVVVAEWLWGKLKELLDIDYDPETATVDETKRVNEILTKCVKAYEKESKEYEKDAKKIANQYFQKIVDLLREVNEMDDNENIIEEYIFDMLEQRKEKIDKDFENIYSKEISNAFSLNNNKLLDILKMGKSREKRDKLNSLAKNTIKNANKKLTDALKNSVSQEQDYIMEKLSKYMKNREDLLETSKRETENIIKISEADKEERQKLQAKYENISNKLDLLENLMEA